MSKIGDIKQLYQNPYLNFYEFEAIYRNGHHAPYYVSSRSQKDRLMATTHTNKVAGAVLYGVYGQNKDKLVLIRQFRYPLGDYCYEFPSGLVEPGEDILQGGIREMYEETGLTFIPREGHCCSRPFFTSVGMTDESCSMIYGYCSGTPNTSLQEESEDIQVILADREECRRILKEENVAIMCAYMLMHFIASEGDPLAFLDSI